MVLVCWSLDFEGSEVKYHNRNSMPTTPKMGGTECQELLTLAPNGGGPKSTKLGPKGPEPELTRLTRCRSRPFSSPTRGRRIHHVASMSVAKSLVQIGYFFSNCVECNLLLRSGCRTPRQDEEQVSSTKLIPFEVQEASADVQVPLWCLPDLGCMMHACSMWSECQGSARNEPVFIFPERTLQWNANLQWNAGKGFIPPSSPMLSRNAFSFSAHMVAKVSCYDVMEWGPSPP